MMKGAGHANAGFLEDENFLSEITSLGIYNFMDVLIPMAIRKEERGK